MSLANHGVVFVDELAEFIASLLDSFSSDTIVVTVEQLISTRGDVVAWTVLEKAPYTRTECIGWRMTPRYAETPPGGAVQKQALEHDFAGVAARRTSDGNISTMAPRGLKDS